MGSSWTEPENKVFEKALNTYNKDAPDYWENVARAVGGGKTVDDMKRHYEYLQRDIDHIVSDGLRRSQYGGGSNSKGGGSSSKDQRYPKPQ